MDYDTQGHDWVRERAVCWLLPLTHWDELATNMLLGLSPQLSQNQQDHTTTSLDTCYAENTKGETGSGHGTVGKFKYIDRHRRAGSAGQYMENEVARRKKKCRKPSDNQEETRRYAHKDSSFSFTRTCGALFGWQGTTTDGW